MWNLTKGKTFLSGISTAQLKKLYGAEKNAKAKVRLLAAIHRKNGRSLDEIAELTGHARSTVHNWLRRFQKRSIEAKDAIKQTGRPAQLTEQQRVKLVKILERGPPHNANGLWNTKEVKDLIKKKFKRTFVNQHIRRILVELGFSLQTPGKQHYKSASEEEKKKFKKKQEVRPDIIERKDLLWARRMRPRLVSSR